MVKSKSQFEDTPCFASVLASSKVFLVEGDVSCDESYEKAWAVASEGLRPGNVDVVLITTSEFQVLLSLCRIKFVP